MHQQTVFINRSGRKMEVSREAMIWTIEHPQNSHQTVVPVGSVLVPMYHRNPATTLGGGAAIFHGHPILVEPRGENKTSFWTIARCDKRSRESKTLMVKVHSEAAVKLESGKAKFMVSAENGQEFLLQLPVDGMVTIRRINEKEGENGEKVKSDGRVIVVLYNEDGQLKKADNLSELSRTEFGKRVILAPTVMTENVGEKTNAEQAGQKAA